MTLPELPEVIKSKLKGVSKEAEDYYHSCRKQQSIAIACIFINSYVLYINYQGYMKAKKDFQQQQECNRPCDDKVCEHCDYVVC